VSVFTAFQTEILNCGVTLPNLCVVPPFVRKAAARTARTLRRRIGSFVPSLSAKECANYFVHDGYASI